MSKKTSTAALESFCTGQLTTRRRAPRHPAGEKKEVMKQGSNEVTKDSDSLGRRGLWFDGRMPWIGKPFLEQGSFA
jgi:hypothetical protein